LGIRIAQLDNKHYGNSSQDDIKMITIKWNYYARHPSHKLYKADLINNKSKYGGDGFPAFRYSDEPNSFFEGMVQRLDWKKLEVLLTK
jgi:hypothetical protein